jgi:hypothetical protein
MKKPIGVILAAGVAMLGSLFFLFVAAGMLVTSGSEPPPGAPPVNFQAFAVTVSLFVAAMGVFGVATAVGLLRLRPWARMATLVFAGLMAGMCLLMLIMLPFMPIQTTAADMTPDKVKIIRTTMYLMFGIPFLIGVWWLIQFNLGRTKAAFVSPDAPAETSLRPISVSIIAWLSIIGGIFCLPMAIAGLPAFVFGVVLTGWSATLTYVVYAALATFLGFGLLRLDERARLASMGLYVLYAIHGLTVTLVPSMREKMRKAQEAFGGRQPEGFDPQAFTTVMMLVMVVLIGVAIWLLIRAKPAFDRAHDEQMSAGSSAPPM